MFQSSSLRATFLTAALGLLVATAPGQRPVTVCKSLGPSISVGNGNMGGTLGAGISTATVTGMVFGLSYQPTQQAATASMYAHARLFGASGEAAAMVGNASVRDGTWWSISDPFTGQSSSYFQPGAAASASIALRVAGQTVYSVSQTASVTFNRTTTLPLFSVSAPSIGVGPVSIRLRCSLQTTGWFWGGLTLRSRSGGVVPSISSALHGHGYINGSYGISASIGIAAVNLSADIRLGATHVDADAETTHGTGRLYYAFEPMRLYARISFRVGAGIASKSYSKTLYNETPFGGYENTLTM